MDLTLFFSCALATWRISNMLIAEDGPLNIMYHIRLSFGVQHDDDRVPMGVPDKFPSNLFGCVWCMSVWIGLGYVILYAINPDAALYLSMPFAYSAVACIIDSI